MTTMNESFQEQFLDELLQEAWFSPDQGMLLKEDLRPLLQERIILSVYQELNPEERKKLEILLKEHDSSKVQTFLSQTIPDFEEFLFSIYAGFEEEYLANFKKN